MNMKKLTKVVLSTIMAATCAISCLSLPATTVMAATGDVYISSSNFSDYYFREYVKKFDTNKNGVLSQAEREAVTEINLRNDDNIVNLKGIEFFPNLKKLDARYAKKIQSAYLNANTKLEYVDFETAPLDTIKIDYCTNLTRLDLFGTKITRLDILACPNLEYLDVGGSELKEINIVHHSSLQSTYENNSAKDVTYFGIDAVAHGDYKSGVYFSYSHGADVITTCPSNYVDLYPGVVWDLGLCHDIAYYADVNHDFRLTQTEINNVKYFTVNSNTSSIDGLKIFPNLVTLTIESGANISSFDGSIFPNLTSLSITNSKVNSVNITSNSALKKLFCTRVNTKYIDTSNNPNLEQFDAYKSSIETVDFSNNPKLTYICVESTDVSSIDLTCLPELTTLYIGNTSISELDLSRNPKLNNIITCWTNVYTLNISNNPELIAAYVAGNPTYDGDAEMYSGSVNKHIAEFWVTKGVTTIIIDQPIPVDPPVNPGTSNPTTPGVTGGTTTPSTTPTVPGGNPGTITPTTPVTPAPETGLAGFIERLYNVALGRQSEAQGKEWWINKVKFENYTGSDVANGFLVSDEFLGKQMTNDQFLEVLYKTFFDRNSDAQGKAYWLNLMANGYSKQDVINGFCNSTEWANLCLTYGIPSGSSAAPTIVITPNEGTNAFVTRLYTTCLGRQPEAAGFEYWTYRLANMQERGSSAAYGFFTSPEFTGKGYDNPTYVTLLYRTILGREPDQAGLNYWLNLMANGMNRVDVLNGFAASTEWADICSSYGILK